MISQVLLPKKEGNGRVAAFEVMLMTPAIGNLIRKNRANEDPVDDPDLASGMITTLDDYLLDLVRRGEIDKETALDAAQDRADLGARLG
ncbi:MAG: hypothetical protein R3F34_07375 [Planctomycetota bacterium]